jgi:uncharacterized protein YcnI
MGFLKFCSEVSQRLSWSKGKPDHYYDKFVVAQLLTVSDTLINPENIDKVTNVILATITAQDAIAD